VSNPFLEVRLPSEAAAVELMKRAILVKAVYELWADGT
jgi:hypothetical protein